MNTFLFREHRGSLDESMGTLVTLSGRRELLAHVHRLLDPWRVRFHDIEIELYSDKPDTRIGWKQTYVVKVSGYGVVGFTDSEAA